jgi:hypothetical protein
MKDFVSPLPAAGWDDDAMERAKDALFNVATIHGYRLGNVELNEAVRAVARALRHNAPASGATKSAACDHHYILMSVGPNGEPVHGVTVDRLSLYPEAMFCQWCNRPQEAQSAGREQNRAALKRSRGRS